MRIVLFLTLSILLSLNGCVHRWVFVTANESTEYFLDTESLVRYSDFTWEARERFLDRNSDRWYRETEVRYDCREKTFMTLRVRGFSEHRPNRVPEVIQGNTPVVVHPGSDEEARLQAVCAIVEGG